MCDLWLFLFKVDNSKHFKLVLKNGQIWTCCYMELVHRYDSIESSAFDP